MKLSESQLRKLVKGTLAEINVVPDLSQLTPADVNDIKNLILIASDYLDYDRPEWDTPADNLGLSNDEIGRLYDRVWELHRLLGGK